MSSPAPPLVPGCLVACWLLVGAGCLSGTGNSALVPRGGGRDQGAATVGARPHADHDDRAFRHPGVLVNQAQLALVRDRVRAGEQPWKDAYERAMAGYGSLARVPRPREVVDCGPYSRPNNGCTDERNDAVAAYTQALAW